MLLIVIKTRILFRILIMKIKIIIMKKVKIKIRAQSLGAKCKAFLIRIRSY